MNLPRRGYMDIRMPGGLRINLCNTYGVKISLVAMLSYNTVCPTGNGYKQIGADTYRQKQSEAFADKRAAGGEKTTPSPLRSEPGWLFNLLHCAAAFSLRM
ncbi:hypothetical protein [Prolixibacter sp. NT017]|uniref:hypothetical protein n=1 Tax=Prolixibacter sp. NT017 TaxID=2652390 RepID=UPI0012990EEB|nr:hypothetical protein [Prolixibacter sp. NT017]